MRIYRKQYAEDLLTVIALFDQQLQATVPATEDNRDYRCYLALLGESRALALDVGEALPDGVEETVEEWIE